jgi:hypothetical protein
MSGQSLTVVGSINEDVTAIGERLPRPGETVVTSVLCQLEIPMQTIVDVCARARWRLLVRRNRPRHVGRANRCRALGVACAVGAAAVGSRCTQPAFSPLHHYLQESAATEPFSPATT